MMLAQVDSTAFRLFGILVYWYTIIIISGIALAVWLSSREAICVGLKEDDVFGFMLWGLPVVIVGARLYYVAFQWQDYADNSIKTFFTRNGDLATYGGLIGGGLALFFSTRHRFIPTWTSLDIAAPGVILAQAIGRWGNFMNHETYGPATTRQFLENLHLPTFIIGNMNINGTYHQPTFLYESIWDVLGFIVLVLLHKKPRFLKEGEVFLGYIIWYSFGHFFIEGLRMDSLYAFSNIRVSQLLSLVMFVAAIVIVIVRKRNPNLKFYNREKQKKKITTS